MMKTYKGHFENGHFVSKEKSSVPENVEVYIVVTDNVICQETKRRKQREAFEKFIKAVQESEPLGEDFDEVMGIGIHVGTRLDG